MWNGKTNRMSGFSITELLVVIAIIGLMVLVVVPNFITYYKSSKMRISVRQFTTDVRRVRQTAITSHTPTKLSFKTDGSGEYRFYRRNNDCSGVGVAPDPDPCWQVLAPVKKNLESTVFFGTASTFADVTTGAISPDPDGVPDIVFLPSGEVTAGSVVIATNNDIPKKEYTISFSTTGRLATN